MSELLENGYPYSDPLPQWIEHSKDLINNSGKAVMILIDGELGDGKSTMAAQMLRQFDPKLDGTKESYALRYHLGGEALLNGFEKAYQAGCKAVIFDESGIDMSSRRAMSSMNMRLLQLFQIYRAYEMAVLMIVPTIKILDTQIFDYGIHRFTVHVHGLRRGKYNRFTVYDREATIHLNHHLRQYRDTRRAYKQSFSNFDGVSKPLPPEHQRIVDELGFKAKQERTEKLKRPDGYTFPEACANLKTSPETLKRWIMKLGIKTFKDPVDRRQKMMTKEDYHRIRVARGGDEAI